MAVRHGIKEGDIELALRRAAIQTMTLIFDALVETMLGSGVTVYEACQLLRRSAVRQTASKMQQESGRTSFSQIAAMTGLSRAEVARLAERNDEKSRSRLSQNPIQRVIAVWHDSPKYINKLGEPAHLQIFGGRRSFEELVTRVGSGVPVRAMLDEMTRLGVVEILPDQKVKIKSRIAVNRGLSETSIRDVGIRASNLIRTLTTNISSDSPLFEASVSATRIDPQRRSMLLREVGNRGTSFLSNIESLLKEAGATTGLQSAHSESRRAGVGVYYFEESPTYSETVKIKAKRRTNYKRLKNSK
jgi:hypothetical protein